MTKFYYVVSLKVPVDILNSLDNVMGKDILYSMFTSGSKMFGVLASCVSKYYNTSLVYNGSDSYGFIVNNKKYRIRLLHSYSMLNMTKSSHKGCGRRFSHIEFISNIKSFDYQIIIDTSRFNIKDGIIDLYCISSDDILKLYYLNKINLGSINYNTFYKLSTQKTNNVVVI